MSEARTSYSGPGDAPDYVARLRFAANEPLRDHLADFHTSPFAARMGQAALFLYSEAGMFYHRGSNHWHDDDTAAGASDLQRVDGLHASLRHRAHGQRLLLPRAEFKLLPDSQPGMLIRLGVVVDELAFRALQDTVFLDADRTVRVGFSIPAERLHQPARLQEARDQLIEALQTGSPLLAVDTLELIERQRHT